MRSRILGLFFILYSILIGFLYLSHSLGNYLAPTMQIYILISGPILLLVGIVLLFLKNDQKIKISDFVLILPLIVLMFAGDGRLSSNFAQTRGSSFSSMGKVSTTSQKSIEEVLNSSNPEYDNLDFTHVDFEITDETYMGLSDYITYGKYSDRAIGKTIRVRGFVVHNASFVPDGLFAIGKYLISCCAADAGFGGFFAKSDDNSLFQEDSWYEIEGVFEYGLDTYGNIVPIIRVIHSKKISGKNEELYVYPCYAYGDGSCKKIIEYNLN